MNHSDTSIRNHCLSPARAKVAIDAPLAPTTYGRMFPELPSFDADERFLHALGRAGGLCDCGDVDDSPDSLGDAAAGWPIFGQFVAHDITADRSILRSHTNTAELHNARSPQLNLECLYGDGPTGHPFLYQRDDPAKFLIGVDGADLQRNVEGIAVIGDPRNDSHMLMSQLHLAMLKAHNTFVDEARVGGAGGDHVFDLATRQLRWHYQWIILNEFLPTLVGQALADQVLREGPQWFRPDSSGFIPLEVTALYDGTGAFDPHWLNGTKAAMDGVAKALQEDPHTLDVVDMGFLVNTGKQRPCQLCGGVAYRASDSRRKYGLASLKSRKGERHMSGQIRHRNSCR